MRTKHFLPVAVLLLAASPAGRTARAQCTGPLHVKIVRTIQDKYRDLGDPDFSFIDAVSPPSEVLANLKSSGFDFDPIAPDRTDLSFVYHIKNPRIRTFNNWRLYFSMVGKYAVLLREITPRKTLLVTGSSNLNWPMEREIIRVLSEKHYEVLSKAVLSCTSGLTRMQNMQRGETIMFWHALFRDERRTMPD